VYISIFIAVALQMIAQMVVVVSDSVTDNRLDIGDESLTKIFDGDAHSVVGGYTKLHEQ
jgi:hypothetical protein